MQKKLPKVFANPQQKQFNNNEKVYYSKEKVRDDKIGSNLSNRIDLKNIESKNIYQKLNDIFSSERYVYKADVDIMTKNGKIRTKLIGQNRTHVITMDNQLISIGDIEDIKFID